MSGITRTTTRRWPLRSRDSIGQLAPLSRGATERYQNLLHIGFRVGNRERLFTLCNVVQIGAVGVDQRQRSVSEIVCGKRERFHLRLPLSVGGLCLRTLYRGCQVTAKLTQTEPEAESIEETRSPAASTREEKGQ